MPMPPLPEEQAVQAALGSAAPGPVMPSPVPMAGGGDQIESLITELIQQVQVSRDPRLMSLLVKLLQLRQQSDQALPEDEPPITFPAGAIQEQ